MKKIAVVGYPIHQEHISALTGRDDAPIVIVDNTKDTEYLEEFDELPEHLLEPVKQKSQNSSFNPYVLEALATGLGASSSNIVDVTPKFYDGPPLKQKGHSKFIIEGVEIYALNYKNALKKYENRLASKDK